MPMKTYKYCPACGVSTTPTEMAQRMGFAESDSVTILYTQAELDKAVREARIEELGNTLNTLRDNSYNEGLHKLCVRFAGIKNG